MSAPPEGTPLTSADVAEQLWCAVCGHHHGVADLDVHRCHVVSPREMAPGFGVAIDLEDDTGHALTRFLTPAVLAAFGEDAPGGTAAPG